MRRRANALRNELISAVESNDVQAAQDALAKARSFDQANPAFAILPRISAAAKARRKERALASQTGTPLGTKQELSDRARFADFD